MHIKKQIFILLLLCFSFLYAQESVNNNITRSSKNSIYALGYGGVLTIGYERLLTDRLGLNISAASLALLHEDLRNGFSFPVYLSFYPIGNVHRLFFDFGFNFITKGKSNPMFDFYDGINVPIIIGTGYNYHPNDGGLFAKLGGGLFLYSPNKSEDPIKAGFMLAIALGISF